VRQYEMNENITLVMTMAPAARRIPLADKFDAEESLMKIGRHEVARWTTDYYMLVGQAFQPDFLRVVVPLPYCSPFAPRKEALSRSERRQSVPLTFCGVPFRLERPDLRDICN